MWYYQGNKIDSLKDLPKDAFGFVYKITNEENGKFYIGRKQLIFSRKIRLNKKERKKTGKRIKIVHKESDWLTYNGSSEKLLKDIKNGSQIKKEILKFVKTKQQLTYYELKYQFIEEVLEKDSYNDNICGRFFRKIFN